jgi:parallel beta-helix repeat protein
VHFFYDGLIAENLIQDNHCLGIWLDNQWYGTRVTSNTIVNSGGAGIFVEMGEGPCLVDNNIIAYSQANEGIYLHDASGVTIAHNLLFANGHFGIYARIVTERDAGSADGERRLVATRDLNIYNNIFIDNYRGHISLPLEDGDRVRNNRSDYNLFINGTQWHWEGLGFNSFTLGSNDKRISEDRLAAALTEAFDRHNYPAYIRLVENALWQRP